MDNQTLNQQLKNILFIDIETVSASAALGELNERLQQHWNRKSATFRNEEGKTPEELFENRAAIFAEFGKVVCIGMGAFYENKQLELCFKVTSLSGTDETGLLTGFTKVLSEHKSGKNLILCAHNGKEFDFPYLCRRMLVNGLPLPNVLNISGKKPWEINHLDTMELWKFGDYKHFTSLDLLGAVFNIPSSKSGLDGSEVSRVYYESGDINAIRKYCEADVVVLAQLYLRLKGAETIPAERVFNTNI